MGPCEQLPTGTFLPESASWASGRVRCMPLCFFSMTPSPRLPSFSRPLEGKRGPGPSDVGGWQGGRGRLLPGRLLGSEFRPTNRAQAGTINNVLSVLLPPPQPPSRVPSSVKKASCGSPAPHGLLSRFSVSTAPRTTGAEGQTLPLSGQKPPPAPGHGEAFLHFVALTMSS